jgi:hypothetical protein
MREQRRLARLRHYDDEDATLSAEDVREAVAWVDFLSSGRFTMPSAKQRALAEYSTDAELVSALSAFRRSLKGESRE